MKRTIPHFFFFFFFFCSSSHSANVSSYTPFFDSSLLQPLPFHVLYRFVPYSTSAPSVHPPLNNRTVPEIHNTCHFWTNSASGNFIHSLLLLCSKTDWILSYVLPSKICTQSHKKNKHQKVICFKKLRNHVHINIQSFP